MYPLNVPHLHRFCTFNVLPLQTFVAHSKLEQLATLFENESSLENIVRILCSL